MTSMVTKPNFFLVGFPKSGTSAVCRLLMQNTEVYIPEREELLYFCTDLIKESKRNKQKIWNKPKLLKYCPFILSEKEYLKYFDNTRNAKIIGDISRLYIFSKVAAEKIFSFNRKARILIMVREPVDFLYSLYSATYRSSMELLTTFKEALNAEESRKKGENPIIKDHYPLSVLFYSEWVKYSDHIKRFMDIFPKEQLKIVIYDDFKNDNIKILGDILEFLGLSRNFTPENVMPNPNLNARFPRIKMLVEKLPILTLKEHLSKSLYNALLTAYSKMVLVKAPRPVLDNSLRKDLIKKYRPEVEKLEKLLGRDLISLWNYN